MPRDPPWAEGTAAKLLFPLQLGPDIVSNTAVGLLLPFISLAHEDPHWGGNLKGLVWVLSPIFGPVVGVHDAWHGYGFWQPGIMPKEQLHRSPKRDVPSVAPLPDPAR